MSEAFRTAVTIQDRPGLHAVWQATFATEDSRRSVECATKAEAYAWLDQMTRAWFDDRLVMPSPDGDGVVVTPPPGADFSMTVPALAVRVREVSPLAHAPHLAAQVTERVHYSHSLLEEALGLLVDAGATDLQGLTSRALDRVATLREHLATNTYALIPVERSAHTERVLWVVPDPGTSGGAA